MKIALVANNLRAGGGRVVMNELIPALLRHLSKHELLAILPFKCEFQKDFPNVKFYYPPYNPFSARIAWQKFVMEGIVKKFAPDWTFMGGNYAIKGLSGRQAMLMHNLNLCMPVNYSELTLRDFLFTCARKSFATSTFKYADSIYFQTETPRNMFVDYHNIDKSKTFVIPMSYPSDFNKEDFSKREAGKNNDDNLFTLGYIAKPYEMKNHAVIIEAYAKFSERLKGTRCLFTFGGFESPFAKSLKRKVEECRIEKSIVFVSEVSRADINKFYKSIDALLMPTKRETLGIPYLESMIAKIPIITSDLDFAHSVCGDAAEYVNPLSAESVCDAVCKLRDSQQKRAQLVEKGLKRIDDKCISWSDAAEFILRNEKII